MLSTAVYTERMSPPPPAGHTAALTRAALLKAAKRQFAANGYAPTGLRDIAAAAGVNVALVNRYFGSKDELFRQAVSEQFSVAAFLGGERADLGFRLAATVLSKTEESSDLDPLLALLRSVTGEPATSLLRTSLDQQFVAPLAEWLGGPQAQTRAGLVVAHLMGLAMTRFVIQSPALTHDPELVLTLSARHLQALIDD